MFIMAADSFTKVADSFTKVADIIKPLSIYLVVKQMFIMAADSFTKVADSFTKVADIIKPIVNQDNYTKLKVNWHYFISYMDPCFIYIYNM